MSSDNEKESSGLPARRDLFHDFPEGQYNRLLPTQTFRDEILPHFALSVEVVTINPDPNAGYVYKQKENSFGLKKPALETFAHAAGIVFHPTLSGVDERTDTRVRYTAVGGMKKEDGTLLSVKKTYELDLLVLEDEIRAQYERKSEGKVYPIGERNPRPLKADEKEAWIRFHVKRDLLQKRRHLVTLAETGACDRVIRSLMAIKSTYTKEELSKPFALPRVNFTPDPNDKEARNALLGIAEVASGAIYPSDIRTPDRQISGPKEPGRAVEVAPEEGVDLEAALEVPVPPDAPTGEIPVDANEEELRKLGRIAELEAMDIPELKEYAIKQVKAREYPTDADPAGFMRLWVDEKKYAEAVYELEKWIEAKEGAS